MGFLSPDIPAPPGETILPPSQQMPLIVPQAPKFTPPPNIGNFSQQLVAGATSNPMTSDISKLTQQANAPQPQINLRQQIPQSQPQVNFRNATQPTATKQSSAPAAVPVPKQSMIPQAKGEATIDKFKNYLTSLANIAGGVAAIKNAFSSPPKPKGSRIIQGSGLGGLSAASGIGRLTPLGGGLQSAPLSAGNVDLGPLSTTMGQVNIPSFLRG